MFCLLLINYHLFWNFHFDYVYLYVGGAQDFWYEKSVAWVKKVGKHCFNPMLKTRKPNISTTPVIENFGFHVFNNGLKFHINYFVLYFYIQYME